MLKEKKRLAYVRLLHDELSIVQHRLITTLGILQRRCVDVSTVSDESSSTAATTATIQKNHTNFIIVTALYKSTELFASPSYDDGVDFGKIGFKVGKGRKKSWLELGRVYEIDDESVTRLNYGIYKKHGTGTQFETRLAIHTYDTCHTFLLVGCIQICYRKQNNHGGQRRIQYVRCSFCTQQILTVKYCCILCFSIRLYGKVQEL